MGELKMKVVIVYGTRPEILKLVPLILKLKEREGIELKLINIGQHKEMVSEVEDLFKIVPHYALNIMQHDQTLTDILQHVAVKVEPILKEIRPDIVLLQGDTSTAATVSTVCFYNKIPIGHVEAGLRSGNLAEPFPEEFNRRVISIVAHLNFAPTQLAADNLLNEGIPAQRVVITGNTIVDMVELVRGGIKTDKKGTGRKILITAHRRENHGSGIYDICAAVKKMTAEFPDICFTWPVHPNPTVKNMVYKELSGLKNVMLRPPMNYLELIKELDESYVVWSDSGGIQEECPSFKKPLLILRSVTERPEVVTSGFGELVGTDTERIVRRTSELLLNKESYLQMISGKNPFGDGTASDQIIKALLEDLNNKI